MVPEAAQSSETERIVKVLKRFRPRDSVLILADEDGPIFLKTWALARLLAWAVLDQRPGKRRPKASVGEAKPRRAIRSRIAKQAGHLTLASLLDRRIRRDGVKREDETLGLMLAVFMESGGFGLFVQGRGATGLVSKVKRASRELGYVYRIVLFLLRYKKHVGVEDKFDIEAAKYFVNKNQHEDERTYGLSKISKTWEKYRQAAPYVFAFYRYFSSALDRIKSPTQMIDFVERLSSNQQRLNRIMGRAAYAADILNERARRVRVRDFERIPRVEPPLPSFHSDELTIIHSIDRHAPIR